MLNGKIKAAVASIALCAALLLTAVPVHAAGLLSIAVSKPSLNVGETVVITVYAEGDGGQEVNADMTITYDAGILEYVGSSAQSASGGGGTVKAVGSEIEYTFKALASGTASIVADGVTMTSSGVKIPVSGGVASTEETTSTEAPAAEAPATDTASTDTASTDTPAAETTEGEGATAEAPAAENASTEAPVLREEQTLEVVKVKKGLTLADDVNAGVTETTGVQVQVEGVTYEISASLSVDDIPEGFFVADLIYGDKTIPGLVSKNGYVYMFYLVNTADYSDQGFYVYDPDSNFFYPFIRLMAGKNKIQVMNPVDIVVVPEGFTKVVMNYKGKKFTAYKCEANPDFFAVYGADLAGVPEWYQFDKEQLSIQRLNIITVYEEAEQTDDQAYDNLNTAYDELSDKYVNEKNSFITTVAVLIFVIAVLIVAVINLILRCREIRKMYEDDDYDDEYEDDDEDEDEAIEKKSSFIEEQYNKLKRTEENPRAQVIHKDTSVSEKKEDFDVSDIKIQDIKIADIEIDEIEIDEIEESADYDDFDDEDDVLEETKKKKMSRQSMNIAVRESVMKNSGESLIGRKEKTPEFKSSDEDDDLEFLDI